MHQFAAYLKEREDVYLYENEVGFAIYYLNGDECYIRDIYVNPDYRKSGEASKIADQVSILAKKSGCKFLTGSVQPSAKNSTDSLKVLLGYGFQLQNAVPNGIFFKKEL